jgi:hypothetical protein
MPGDKAVARTVAVIVLVLLAIIALRGYLPGAEPAPPEEPTTGGPGSVVAVLAMLGLSITVIVIAVVTQARRRPAAHGAGEPPRGYRSERTGLPWRLLLIAAASLLAWALVVLLLMQWGSDLAPDEAPLTNPEPNPAQETGRGGEPAPPEPPAADNEVFGYLAATATALVVLSVAATMVGRRRVATPTAVPVSAGAPDPADAGGPDLARAAELGLAEIGDRSRDPREAIIACYAAMEQELDKSPGTSPQDSDTPSEVLARAVELHALQSHSATELVDLFEEARFSPHVMNEGHRADAMRALRLVQRELQGAT